MTPRVSIITPFLDAARYLPDAIRSVRAQSFPDWELVLVDDGSSDDSAAICALAAVEDCRIRVLPATDGGRGAAVARNRGLREARGEFVAFLDADDLFLPDKLRDELALMDRHGEAMMVCGAALWWYPEDRSRNWIDRIRSAPGLYHPPELLNRILLLRRDQVPCICAVLIRVQAIEVLGGLEESLRLYEDQSLWVKIMSHYPVFMGRHLTSIYRQHPDSTSARAERAGEYDRLRIHAAREPFLAWIMDYLKLSETRNASTDRALRLAVAVVSGNRAYLSPSDRAGLVVLRGHDLVRKVIAGICRLLRWLLGRRVSKEVVAALDAVNL